MNYDYKKLRPFKWFVLQNFPFIEADFDAITNWQLFCKLGEEINKIIKSNNLTGQQVEDLTNAFNDLQNYVNNYFENLDIQTEVNNKLDEMAEGGELQEIIAEYLQVQSLLCFNNVLDLQNAENLAEGSFVRTYGTLHINDGIMYHYKIRQIQNTDVVDNLQIIGLTNYPTLIAERIHNAITNDKSNPIYYGADPTGTIDSSSAINDCIQANLGGTINFSEGTYLVNQTINLPYTQTEKVSINGNGAKLINNVTLDRLFYVGFDKGLQGANDVGFPSYIKDLFISGESSSTSYAIDIIKGYKDLKIYNCRIYRFLNGIRIGESTGNPADVLMENCLLYGKGSEYDGTGVIANCTDNNINMCRIYGFRKGFIINGACVVKECHVLLRWANQTSANFDPYTRNGTEFNEYYPQTMFAEVNSFLRCIDSYADSTYKFLELNTFQSVILIGANYYNARGDVDNRLIDITTLADARPKLLIDNFTIDLGKNTEGEVIHCANMLTNYSQIKISNVLITNIARLTNPADIILTAMDGYISNKPIVAGQWNIVKILSNNSDYNTITGKLYINGYEYLIYLRGGANKEISSIIQGLKSTNNSNWAVGTVTVNGNVYLCIKSSINGLAKFYFETDHSDNIIFPVSPVKNNSIVDSSRVLSDYTELVPTNELALKSVLF